MLPTTQIFYGLGLTALFEVILTVAVPRWRRPALILTTTAVTVLAVLGWQYVLRATHASQFFTDLPFRPFPISWQDTGSGVAALAFVGLALAYGPMRRQPAPAVATLALAAGLECTSGSSGGDINNQPGCATENSSLACRPAQRHVRRRCRCLPRS